MIAENLLARSDVEVRLLVRPGSESKAADLQSRGATVVAGHLDSSPDVLRRACDGVFSVVSAVQGGPDVIVDGQLALLRAARDAGATRFIPSDFSFNLFALGEGENVNSDWRRAFATRAEELRGDVELIHVLNGAFLDAGVLFGFLGAFDLEAGKVFLWGEGGELMDFTTYEDTARYTAEAALDREPLPRHFNVAGDVLDFAGLVAAYERGSGRTLEVERMGTMDDLDAEIARRQAAEPENVFAWLPLMYWRGMLSGKGKLGDLINPRYPAIKPTQVTDYVRANQL